MPNERSGSCIREKVPIIHLSMMQQMPSSEQQQLSVAMIDMSVSMK
ncbi:hypothetical protein [Paenibacillus elgii]|nr:hypothetical protein [Paenibacillus elgii]